MYPVSCEIGLSLNEKGAAEPKRYEKRNPSSMSRVTNLLSEVKGLGLVGHQKESLRLSDEDSIWDRRTESSWEKRQRLAVNL